jgi:alpha-glucosidase
MPFCRVHYARSTHDQIQAAGAAPQEPWSYGPDWEAINRASIERRYTLLPYLYTVFEEMTRTGAPILRPLFFEYPGNPACADVDDEFLVGRDLLVAPVVEEGRTSRSVYLPDGVWCDYSTGIRHAGPAEITVDAPPDTLPVFVRAGTAIPTQDSVACTDESVRLPVRWRVYPDDDGRAEGVVYEDDGHTMDYTREKYRRTRISVAHSSGRTVVETSSEGSYESPRPPATIELVTTG